jgi:hypothetical protein
MQRAGKRFTVLFFQGNAYHMEGLENTQIQPKFLFCFVLFHIFGCTLILGRHSFIQGSLWTSSCPVEYSGN